MGHERGALMTGISAFIGVTRDAASLCFMPCEDRRPQTMNPEKGPNQTTMTLLVP